jgi:hypothetical protein
MELMGQRKTISFLTRIFLQFPTIALATVTMIGISRHLGPSGRAGISQILLLAALASSTICTPIFLNVMHLKVALEIKTFAFESLYLFRQRNVLIIIILNLFFLFSTLLRDQLFNLELLFYMNSLIISYILATQIRDFFLRFHKNKVYGIDFVTQVMLSISILSFLLLQNLSVTKVIQAFVVTHAILAVFLIVLLKKRVQEFEYIDLIRKKSRISQPPGKGGSRDSFANLGILFHLTMSKDLLIGMVLLSKVDFGLMAALASFWGVIRFIRPSAVIQTKLESSHFKVLPNLPKWLLYFYDKGTSAIYLQLTIIGAVGLASYVMMPILLGSRFSPSVQIVLVGTIAEMLLMKCLYDLSTSTSSASQRQFWLLSILQATSLMVLKLSGFKLTIESIWISSSITYLLWQILSTRVGKKWQ